MKVQCKLARVFFCCFILSPLFKSTFAEASSYFCTSAETNPVVNFTVLVRETSDHQSATVTLTFPQSNPAESVYDNVLFDSADSGADHVAFAKEGIAVVVYPDPSILSTVTIGDSGGTQVGLAMRCKPDVFRRRTENAASGEPHSFD